MYLFALALIRLVQLAPQFLSVVLSHHPYGCSDLPLPRLHPHRWLVVGLDGEGAFPSSAVTFLRHRRNTKFDENSRFVAPSPLTSNIKGSGLIVASTRRCIRCVLVRIEPKRIPYWGRHPSHFACSSMEFL